MFPPGRTELCLGRFGLNLFVFNDETIRVFGVTQERSCTWKAQELDFPSTAGAIVNARGDRLGIPSGGEFHQYWVNIAQSTLERECTFDMTRWEETFLNFEYHGDDLYLIEISANRETLQIWDLQRRPEPVVVPTSGFIRRSWISVKPGRQQLVVITEGERSKMVSVMTLVDFSDFVPTTKEVGSWEGIFTYSRRPAVYSPCGSYLLASFRRPSLFIWETATYSLVWQGNIGGGDLWFCRDGTLLCVWDTSEGELLCINFPALRQRYGF
jgi:hypothetical protein